MTNPQGFVLIVLVIKKPIVFLILALAWGSSAEEPSPNPAPLSSTPSWYLGAALGVGDFVGTADVQGKLSKGLIFGRDDLRWRYELQLLHSQFDVTGSRCSSQNCQSYSEPFDVSLSQFTLAAGAKYLVSKDEDVRPFLGGFLQSHWRNYENKREYFVQTSGSPRKISSLPSSWALNLALAAGAEVRFNPTFGLVAELQYSIPLKSQVYGSAQDDQLSGGVYDNNRKIEELNQYLLKIACIVWL